MLQADGGGHGEEDIIKIGRGRGERTLRRGATRDNVTARFL